MKVIIVGGVAGGATAAARIRRLDEQAEIIVFERSGFISYANCGLPYYIGGVIEDPEDLTLQTPESFWQRFRIHMKVHHEVTAVHPDKKTVSVKNLETLEVFEETYDKLLLSPGAKPLWPDLPGMESRKLFTLRTVEDTFRIRDFVDQQKPKSAVMVGGGFERMTRFWLKLEDGVEFVLKSFQRMQGGEIFIPKIPSMRILDLAKAIAPEAKIRIIGIRPGEKLHEVMCPSDLYYETIEFSDHFVIKPSIEFKDPVDYTINLLGEKGHMVPDGFDYNSGNNPYFLSVEELRKMNT